MKPFDFEKFEGNTDKLARGLKMQMQTRLFHPVSPDFTVTVEVHEVGKWKTKKVEVQTSDIGHHQNFKMFDSVYLHNFGGNPLEDSPDGLYWLPIDWRWTSKSGGGNGTSAFTCYINDDGEIVKVKE